LGPDKGPTKKAEFTILVEFEVGGTSKKTGFEKQAWPFETPNPRTSEVFSLTVKFSLSEVPHGPAL
jgi:hypothetical protein